MADVADSLFISWIRYHQRSADLAAQLGARAEFVAAGSPLRRHTAPLRYAIQAFTTARLLRRTRPRVVYAMAPPAVLPLVIRAVQGRRTVLVVDAHSKAVFRVGASQVRASYRITDRCADAVVVTNEATADRLAGRRAPVFVADDPLPRVDVDDVDEVAGAPAGVVYPASWERDEPIREVITAAALVPELEWHITGNPRRPPAALPANVRLTGYLARADYLHLLQRAEVVLALTTRPNTMQRAAYEAMVLHRPLVVSDTAALRALLGEAAAYTRPDADSIASAVRAAVAHRDERVHQLAQLVPQRRELQERAVARIGSFARSLLDARRGR